MFIDRSISTLDFFQRISVDLHRENSVMTIARMNKIPAVAIFARPDSPAASAASTQEQQSTLTEDDLMG